MGLIDIMLFYVEQGVRFTDAYGDIDEPFYISMETMYEKAVNEIIKHRLKDTFQKRCQKIVSDTSEMGWGFPDTLSEIYEDAFQWIVSPAVVKGENSYILRKKRKIYER